MNPTGDELYDVAIVGLGPAGRALASACGAAGLHVLALDPRPDAPWTQTLSLWTDQLPTWLSPDVLAHTVSGPTLYCPSRTVLDRDYSVFDNARLREALPLTDAVTVEAVALGDAQVADLTRRAHRVVDCRGAGGPSGQRPLQTAYGLVLPTAAAAPAMGGDPALFMDWRTDFDADDDGTDHEADDDELGPSFLYAIPLDSGSILLEETCLAGCPAPDPQALGRRLRSRLVRRGVAPEAIAEPLEVEEVRIPLLPPVRTYDDPRVEAFGTAGGHGHAATGYSIAASFRAVPAAVNALRTGYPLPRPRTGPTGLLHKTGLRALLGADEPTVQGLFGAFGRITDQRQQWFLDGSSPSYQVARAMWDMWACMPVRGKVGMIAAVLGGSGRSSARGRAETVEPHG